MHDLEVADSGVVAEKTLGGDTLGHHARRHGPIVVDVDLQSRAAALHVHRVVVVPPIGGIADGSGTDCTDWRARRHCRLRAGLAIPGWKGAYTVDDTSARVRSGHVIDIAAIVLVIADQAHRCDGRERYVDIALRRITLAPVIDLIALDIVTRRKPGGIRLVGDDAHRACFGTRAV